MPYVFVKDHDDNHLLKINSDGSIGLQQSITTAFVNTDNIASGATYTSDVQETLGINGLQVYLFADRDCTLYVDQGVDGTNWDITDTIDCLANTGYSRIIVSVAPY